MSCLILTYHSHVVNGTGYAHNDHVALAEDLRHIDERGIRIVPLTWIVDWLLGKRRLAEIQGALAITFDDGCLMDVETVNYPGRGTQSGFLPILKSFAHSASAMQKNLHATTFVIASEQSRQRMDKASFDGRGWMGDGWWRQLNHEPLMDIQNHSWDHDAQSADEAQEPSFLGVEDKQSCDHQILEAGRKIAELAGLDETPDLFAYPFGESSDYLRDTYLPRHGLAQGLRAAFTTEPALVHSNTSVWAIPRYVCGCDWSSRKEFDELLDSLFAKDAGQRQPIRKAL